ncbi:hypothetical protein JTE90_023732 [Oedothorax gibbosus]|uniref:Uncharacterized protein n=1 Tax=Oedothorax gibbosus TaxID=931172 RepID=A0AAV6V9T6_9ARAC|nr:hypothetical protein JTE90_023732 [Oedothorax gibbosus]
MCGENYFNTSILWENSFFRNVDGVLLVYDVTDMSSFLKLSSWLLDLKSENDNAICFIVGNKLDDPNRNAVCVNQVRNFAEEEQLELHYCSAQTGENVNEIFESLALQILEHKQIIRPQPEQELESSDDSMLATYNVVPPTSSVDQTDYPNASSITLHEPVRSRRKKKKKKECTI